MIVLRVFFSILFLCGSCLATNIPNQFRQRLIDDEIKNESWKGQHIINHPERQYVQNILLNNGEEQNLKTLVPFNNLNHILNPADTNELQRLLQNHNGCCSCIYNWLQSREVRDLLQFGLDNNPIIARYLVNIINSDNVNLRTLGKILGFQYIIHQTRYLVRSMGNTLFWNLPDVKTAFILGNPRAQQRTLNTRELFRFKDIFTNQALNNPLTPMISHSNFQNDDVIRAMSLCGTFCLLEYGDYNPIFSGMLVTGQAYNQLTFDIHTCLHGFANKTINQIYFVPYGLPLIDDTAFQVQEVWRNNAPGVMLNQIHQINLAGMNVYNQRDYAKAVINNRSVGNNFLEDVLNDRQRNNLLGVNLTDLFPNFFDDPNNPGNQNPNLPNFIGSGVQFNNSFQNFDLNGVHGEKYFVIGRPGDDDLALNNSGFSVVTNLSNAVTPNPRRSLQNDPDILSYALNHVNLGFINGEIAIDTPTIPGISGAIAMQTLLHDNAGTLQRVGRGYTVNWGSERIFEQRDGRERIADLKSIISRIN